MSHRPERQRDKVLRGTAIVMRGGTIAGTQAGGRRGLPVAPPYVWRGDGPQPSPAELVAGVRARLDPVRLRLAGYANGNRVLNAPDPAWLAAVSPGGRARWTGDPAQAHIEPTPELGRELAGDLPLFTLTVERVPDVAVDPLPPGPAGGD